MANPNQHNRSLPLTPSKSGEFDILEDDRIHVLLNLKDDDEEQNINLEIDTRSNLHDDIEANVHQSPSNSPNTMYGGVIPALNGVGGGDDSSLSLSGVYSLGNDSNDYYVNRLHGELSHIRNQFSAHSDNRSDTSEISNTHSHFNPDYIAASSDIESLVGSNRNSSFDSDSDLDDSASILTDRVKPKYRKLTYDDVERSLNKYQSKEEQIISEVELLLTYLRGQKHVFKQSNRITIQKYNLLMFPAMSITAGITVLAPFFEDVAWSGWAISMLNALLTVMIAMNNFMKWQAIAELYMNISNQYENLMTSVEMSRNQFDFIEDRIMRKDYILEKMKETERRIMDIKLNYNNVLVPYEIQLHNPIISHINIFSFLRKIEDYKRGLILKYKDVKNEIGYIMYKWERENAQQTFSNRNSTRYTVDPSGNTSLHQHSPHHPSLAQKSSRKQKDIRRLESLLAKKEDIKSQLIHNNTTNVYTYIDNLFTREIQLSEEYYTYHSVGMYIIFPPKAYKKLEYGNPVVDSYLNFVFTKNPEQDMK